MQCKGPILTLNNGVAMPAFGLGVFQSEKAETSAAVKWAIESGYGLIDTAAAYQNEEEVGQAIAESGVARDDIFITTKMHPNDFGQDTALRAFDTSMQKLGIDVLDLYLLHWPVPRNFEATIASWKVCERVLAEGRVRAIGVSNFKPAHMDALLAQSDIVPAVNQIELHPFFVQEDHDVAHRKLGIITQAWSPIGGVHRYRPEGGGEPSDPLHHPTVTKLAEKYGKTAAQIVLRWQIDLGHSAIPKSVKLARIKENIDIFDFSLLPDEIAMISAMDTGTRGGADPETRWTPAGK
jgi:diketogulonate reductase-like aldo/keto reductase